MSKFFDAHYRGTLSWLPERTIILMRHGSHAYGTNGPTSDVDVKGVAIPPKSVLLGFVERFEQADKGWDGVDCTIYDLRKAVGLAADNNPNMIELPFVDQSDWLGWHNSMAWQRIVEHRDLLLSQNCRYRFCGYAMAQLKRIRSHREWLFNPPKGEPTRADFNLPDYTPIPADQRQAAESQIKKQIEAWTPDFGFLDDSARIMVLGLMRDALEDIAGYSNVSIETAAGRKLGFDDNFLEYLDQERAYRAAHARWKQYLEWQRSRNEVRSELERKYGYDTKHGMHLVRLMRMANEIMSGKGVIVKRPDAEELKAIRNGAWTFEQLEAWAEPQEEELVKLMTTTPLPKNPNRTKLDQVVIAIIDEFLRVEG